MAKIRSRPPREVVLSAHWTLVPDDALNHLRNTIAEVRRSDSASLLLARRRPSKSRSHRVLFRLAQSDRNPALAKAIDDNLTSARVREIALAAGAEYLDPREVMCTPEALCKFRTITSCFMSTLGTLVCAGLSCWQRKYCGLYARARISRCQDNEVFRPQLTNGMRRVA